MLSPDPVTQAPENGQNYNRYTYAYNNPLKFTDPSGYTNKNLKCTGDSCNAVLEEVRVGPSEPRPPRGGVTGNQAAFVHSGHGGNNSPQSEPGDLANTSGDIQEERDPVSDFDCSQDSGTACINVTPEGSPSAAAQGLQMLYNLQKMRDELEQCRVECYVEDYGPTLDAAWDLLLPAPLVLALGEVFEEIQFQLQRKAWDNLNSTRHRIGVRQAKTVAQSAGLRFVGGAITAGAGGFVVGAYGTCTARCVFQ